MSHKPVWVGWLMMTIFDEASFLAVVIDERVAKLALKLDASGWDDFRVGLPGHRWPTSVNWQDRCKQQY